MLKILSNHIFYYSLNTTPAVKRFRTDFASQNVKKLLCLDQASVRAQQAEARKTGGGPIIPPVPEVDAELFRLVYFVYSIISVRIF